MSEDFNPDQGKTYCSYEQFVALTEQEGMRLDEHSDEMMMISQSYGGNNTAFLVRATMVDNQPFGSVVWAYYARDPRLGDAEGWAIYSL